MGQRRECAFIKVIFIVKNYNLLPFFPLQPSSNLIASSVPQLAPCSTFLFTLKAGQNSCQGLQLYCSVQGCVSMLEAIWVLLLQKCCHHSQFHFFIKTNAKDFFINDVSQQKPHTKHHALEKLQASKGWVFLGGVFGQFFLLLLLVGLGVFGYFCEKQAH